MLRTKDLLTVHYAQKTSFLGQIEQSKILYQIQQKDAEIKTLKRTIKKLEKQIKLKTQTGKLFESSDGKNSFYKTLLEREIGKNNELKRTISSITDRIKKLTSDIDHQVSISQNSQSMQEIAMILDDLNFEMQKSSSLDQSSYGNDDDLLYSDRALDQLEMAMRTVLMKWGETNKNYKQAVQSQNQLFEQSEHYKDLFKKEKKTKDLLQKLLEKNETEKNLLVNQINMCVNQSEMEDLKAKTKEEVIMFACKLNYRIRDLEQEKENYMKDLSKEMQKEMKLYQDLMNQVKNFKEKARSKHSFS